MRRRRVARRAVRRTTRRVVRRTRRRIVRRTVMVGGMVVLAAAGTAAAIKLTQQDAQRIEEHTGLPPEQLEDQDLQDAMAELNIQSQPMSPGDQAALAQPGGAPAGAPAAPAQENYLAELERLADLRDRGVITVEDFEAKKKQLLGL